MFTCREGAISFREPGWRGIEDVLKPKKNWKPSGAVCHEIDNGRQSEVYCNGAVLGCSDVEPMEWHLVVVLSRVHNSLPSC